MEDLEEVADFLEKALQRLNDIRDNMELNSVLYDLKIDRDETN